MATAELCSQVGLFATALLPQKQTLSAGRRPSDNKSYCGLLGSQTLKGRRKRSEGIGVEKEVGVKSVSEAKGEQTFPKKPHRPSCFCTSCLLTENKRPTAVGCHCLPPVTTGYDART
jgi:hypothetical protein